MKELTEEEKAERQERDAIIKTVRKESFYGGVRVGYAVGAIVMIVIVAVINYLYPIL